MSRIYLGCDVNTDDYNEWVLLWYPAAHYCSADFYLEINKNDEFPKRDELSEKDSE